MASPEGAQQRSLPLLIAGVGALAVLVTLPLGAEATVGGSLVFLVAAVVALRESHVPVITWSNALAALFLVFWLIPMKVYRFPVTLPFALEPYRIFLLLLFVGWVGALLLGRGRASAAGHAVPLALLFFTALGSLIVNFQRLSDLGGGQAEALKPFSFFLGYLLVFVLVASTTGSLDAVNRLVKALVFGGTLVGLAAIYETNTGYNLFEHLAEWVPVLVKEEREVVELRAGKLRVYASAQHPIALGCALTMTLPLAVYLAQHAASKWRTRGWTAAALIIATGASATISRTIVVMGIVMTVMWVVLRRQQVLQIRRFWPVLFFLPVLVHFVAPGAIGGIYKAFFPKQGLVADLGGRAGEGGSGRFADYTPAIRLWEESPLVGRGLGSQGQIGIEVERLAREGLQGVTTAPELIFDNQYLLTLVELGTLGIIGALWFVWGAAIKLGRAAKRNHDPPGDLMAVCAISCAGFGAAMFLFDAWAFVQVTLVFFVIAALGLRARELVLAPVRERARAPVGRRRLWSAQPATMPER
jgi:hypothetical protein